MRRALQMGKNLKTTSTQQTDSSLRVVLQQTTKPRVVASWQTNMSPQVTSAQWTSAHSRVVLQQTAKPRVIASWQIDMSPQVTSVQQKNAQPRAVLQRTTKLRVVARPQADESPIAKSAHPYRKTPAEERERTKDLPVKREVDTIFGGPCKIERSRRVHMIDMLKKQGTDLEPWCMSQMHIPSGYSIEAKKHCLY